MSSAQFASPASPARTLSDASPSANMSPASRRPPPPYNCNSYSKVTSAAQGSHRGAAPRHSRFSQGSEEDKTTLRTSSAKTTTTADAAPALDAATPQLNVMQAQGKADTAHHFKTPPRPRAKKSGASQSRRAKIISLLKRHRSLSLQLSAQTAFASARDAGVNQDSITSDIADVVKQLNDLSVQIPEHLQTKANPQSSGKLRALESSPSKAGGPVRSRPSVPPAKAALRNGDIRPFHDATTTEGSVPSHLGESKTPSRTMPIERTNTVPSTQPNAPSKRFEYLFARIMAGPSPRRSTGAVCAANAPLMTEATSTVPISTPERTSTEACPIEGTHSDSDGYTTPKRQRRRIRREPKSATRVRSSANGQASDTTAQYGGKEQENRLSPRNPSPGSRKRARANDDIGSAQGLAQPQNQPQSFPFSPSSNPHCGPGSERKSLAGQFESLGLVGSPNLFAGLDGVSNMVSPSGLKCCLPRPRPRFCPRPKQVWIILPLPRGAFSYARHHVCKGNRSTRVRASDNSTPHQQATVRESEEGVVPLPSPPMSPILEPVDRSAIFDEHEDLEDLHVVKTLDMFSASKQRRKLGRTASAARAPPQHIASSGTAWPAWQDTTKPKVGNRVNLRNSLSLARK